MCDRTMTISDNGYPKFELSQEQKNAVLSTREEILKFVSTAFKKQEIEFLYSITTTADKKVIAIHLAAIGGEHQATLSPAKIIREAVRDDAYGVIIVHNHPKGDATPSPNDIEAIETLKESAESVGIELIDAIIISGEYLQSMLKDIREQPSLSTRYPDLVYQIARYIGGVFQSVGVVTLACAVLIIYTRAAYGQTPESLNNSMVFLILMYPIGWILQNGTDAVQMFIEGEE